MDMQVDAQLIRNERLKRAWSQEQLAQVSGLGLRTVQRIENGGNASLETIKALAAVLGLPVEVMLTQVPAQQASVARPPPHYSLFRPWRTFVTGFLASLATMGGFVAMQGATAEQVDMDFTLRLDNEEITRSRVVGEAGTAAVVEVSEVIRISVTPRIMPDGAVFLEAEIFQFLDGEFKILAKPKLLAINGQKAVLRVGRQELVEGEPALKVIEFEITPMIE